VRIMNTRSGPEALTDFAPAGRAAPGRLEDEIRSVDASPVLRAVLRAVDGYVLVLNRQRQVLAANASLWRDLGLTAADSLPGGARPGELLRCVHSDEGPDGCGTSRFCSTCGAVVCILAGLESGEPSTRECFLTRRAGEAEESVEFRVRATPVAIPPHDFLVLTLHDISGLKRKEVLERVFIHDLLNTVGGLKGWSQVLESLQEESLGEAAHRIVELSTRLTEEIQDQRILLQAERGDLAVRVQKVPAEWILNGIEKAFSTEQSRAGRNLDIVGTVTAAAVETDPNLAVQVLKRMVRNAVEAAPPGKTVRVWTEESFGEVLFRVWNPGGMSEEAALRVFQRSYTTKPERGRGLGTYAMRLFGERLLEGRVSFETSEAGGTTFTFRPQPRGEGGENVE